MTKQLTGPALVAYLRDNPTSDVMRAAADEIERLRGAHDESESVLLRNGFVRCDIPACACGSWHPRYGLPERIREITDALSEAGHPLNNENGNLVINALGQLVAERDAFREALQSIVDCCDEDHAARDYSSRQTEIRGIARYALARYGEPAQPTASAETVNVPNEDGGEE